MMQQSGKQKKGGLGLFLIVIVLAITLDQASKIWIVQHFSLQESREIIPGLFSLTFLTNNGAAFSLFSGEATLWRQIFFTLVSGLALIFLTIAQRSYGPYSSLYTVSLGLIAGGASGNLIDRLLQGHVVDFLDFYLGSWHWPAFNVADSAICVGVFLFLIKNLLIDRGHAGPACAPGASGADTTSEHGAREQP